MRRNENVEKPSVYIILIKMIGYTMPVPVVLGG